MSYRPKALGGKLPTGVVRSRYPPPVVSVSRVPSKLACSVERYFPKWKGVVVPARQEYSHSASLGRRYTLPVFRSSGRCDSSRQNARASVHVTESTGNEEPRLSSPL